MTQVNVNIRTGPKGLMRSTPEFRAKVVRYVQDMDCTYGEAGVVFGLRSVTIGNWYRDLVGVRNTALSEALKGRCKGSAVSIQEPTAEPVSATAVNNTMSKINELIQKEVPFSISYKGGKPYATIEL